jgi:hypothetical protein
LPETTTFVQVEVYGPSLSPHQRAPPSLSARLLVMTTSVRSIPPYQEMPPPDWSGSPTPASPFVIVRPEIELWSPSWTLEKRNGWYLSCPSIVRVPEPGPTMSTPSLIVA